VIKKMLKKMGGISTYRKGSKRLLEERREKKRRRERWRKKEVIYRIQCSDREMLYVGKTGRG